MSKTCILIVEDEGITALALEETLQEKGYEVMGMASSGEEAIERALSDQPDLILMDIKLQGEIDGIEAANRILAARDVPIIYLTAHSDKNTLERAKRTAQFGYVLKPIRDRELQINIEMALYKHDMDRKLHEALTRLEKSMRGTLTAIGKIVEMRDPSLAGHHQTVSSLATAIAKEMNLPAELVEGIRLGALVHGIGLLGVPYDIATKREKLTPEERRIYEDHTQIAYELLHDIDFVWPIADVARHHHERMNGTGYPDGLKAGSISMPARVVAVAEVVVAKVCGRNYPSEQAQRRPLDEVLKELEEGRATLYDADVVDACLTLFRQKGFQLQCARSPAARQWAPVT